MDQSVDQQGDHSETQAHQERALKKRAPLTNVACADCRKRKIKVRLDNVAAEKSPIFDQISFSVMVKGHAAEAVFGGTFTTANMSWTTAKSLELPATNPRSSNKRPRSSISNVNSTSSSKLLLAVPSGPQLVQR